MYGNVHSQPFPPSAHQQSYPPQVYHQHLQQQQQQQVPSHPQSQQQQQLPSSNLQFHVNGATNNTGTSNGSNQKTLSKLLTAAPTRPSGSRQQQQQQSQQPQQALPNGTPMQRPQMMGGAAGTMPNGNATTPNEMRGSNMQMTKQMMLEQQQQHQQRMYMYQQQNPQAAQNGYMNGHPQGGHPQNSMMVAANQQHYQRQLQQQHQLQQQQQAHQQLNPQQQLLQQQQRAQMYHSQTSQEFVGGMMNGPSTSYSSHPQNPSSMMHSGNQMLQQNGLQTSQPGQNQQQTMMSHPAASNGSTVPQRQQQQQFLNEQGSVGMNNQQQPNHQPMPGQQMSRPLHYQPSTVQGFAPQQPMNPIRHSYPPQPLPQPPPSMSSNTTPQKLPQPMMQDPQHQQMQFQRTASSDLQVQNSNNNPTSFPTNLPSISSYPSNSSLPNGQQQPLLPLNGMNPATNEKRQNIQRQLMILLHANKCKQRELENPNRVHTPCGITFCSAMKNVLQHMGTCRNGLQCTFPHCTSSSQIISHWKKCVNDDCSVCKPLKDSAKQNQNSQRLSVEQELTNGMLATLERDTETIVYTKPWQKSIDKNIKNHLVCKLVKAIFPSPDPAAMHDQRIKDLISYARRIEKDIFEAADSKEEYYEMLAMKIYKIQKELLDKRNKRLGMQNRGAVEPSFALIKQEFQPDLYLPEPPTRQTAAEFLEIKREEENNYFPGPSRMVEIKQEAPPSVPPMTQLEIKQEPPVSVKEDLPSKLAEAEPEPPVEDAIPPEELRQALLPIWRIVDSPEEAFHFRSAVDPGIIGYYDIIKNPMDLSRIRQKLDSHSYRTPWDFAADMWLMIDNAWLFNKKSTKIYKNATRLLEIFTEHMEPLMQKLGYCCGNRYTFTALPLFCYGQSACTIARNQEYYIYETSSSKYGVNVSEKYIYCIKCYEALPDCGINMNENPDAPPNYVPKDKFCKMKNDEIENEPFETCKICRRKWHKICANYSPKVFNDGFICTTCRETKNIPRPENRFTSKKLASCELSKHLENRVNTFMTSKLGEDCNHEVVIRVLHTSDKEVKTKPMIREKYGAPEKFPYRNKVVFAFEVINDIEICFFGLHVQEYGSECPTPNARRVYIAYLDSVHFFEPAKLRTDVYHEILLGYLDYARKLGYTMAHLWACPPSEGDDYIFHCHPPEQKIPKQKRLGNWYKTMLDKAIVEDVVVEYKDIYAQARDDKIKTPIQLPYFEGDFWPNVIEDCIKDIEKKSGGKIQDAMDVDDVAIIEENGGNGKPSTSFDKKGSSTTIKKSASSKKLKASSATDEITDRLFGFLERHKDVFFTIKLKSTPEWSTMPIKDPDPLISCELMDGRDNFLTRAREEHWEFSSLRRAKYSTLCFCHALHSSDNMDNTYTCNVCSQSAIWHCDICPDFDLCSKCNGGQQHEHKLSKVTSIIDVNKSDSNAAREESIRRGIQVLAHASQCRDVNCRRSACSRLKQVLQHVRTCKRRQEASCPICKQLIALCCHHAKVCTKPNCTVPFCPNIRQKLQEQRQLQNRRAEMMMRRRMKLVQSDSPPQQFSQKCDS